MKATEDTSTTTAIAGSESPIASDHHRLSRDEALDLCETRDISALSRRASELRDSAHQDIITFSRNVFIPLTKLCRDVCHYCTFANTPRPGQPAYLQIDEILAIAKKGAEAGCTEALFTLGDKPELRYDAARKALAKLGHETTLSYLAEAARAVYEEVGLLPHLNPGVMTAEEIGALRGVSVSMGIMLETISDRLSEKGGPHFGSPDKAPARRLATIEAAGQQSVPMTTGLLIGIGETRDERIDALLAIRELHEKFGHIQEVIIQNFDPKPGTKMENASPADESELIWTIAAARLVLGAKMNIQTPPNLNTGRLSRLINAGINDWGGVSPVTPDHVNPNHDWPSVERLRRETERSGKILTERLAVYPAFATAPQKWLDNKTKPNTLAYCDSTGFAREDSWEAGVSEINDSENKTTFGRFYSDQGTSLDRVIRQAEFGESLDETSIVQLFEARGGAVDEICAAANDMRAKAVGDDITFVINRNINYTNICEYKCAFCAFSKGRTSEQLRGKPYILDIDEIERRTSEAWDRGATEVCLQGGIHPQYTGDTYLEICRAVRRAAPDIHIHAFSPLEISHGAKTSNVTIAQFLEQLMSAGLGSLPGTAAEILDDEIRKEICPDKLSTAEWLSIIKTAHRVGLPTTSTIMFGHVDHPRHWARHLIRLRNAQEETGGITEFVPLPFVAREAPIFIKGNARLGPTYREALLMHAIARLVLNSVIPNIQTSWVKMGPMGALDCLKSGANDFGGVLMDESITRAAGAKHGQQLSASRMNDLIHQHKSAPAAAQYALWCAKGYKNCTGLCSNGCETRQHANTIEVLTN